MKKVIFVLSVLSFCALCFALCFLLSGCAAYKFQKAQAPYREGFVVARDGYIIPEYTLGKNNTVGDFKQAKERFNRRKEMVEYYYKKMGIIESRLKGYFIDPPIIFVKFITGIFRLPFIAASDYRYEHNQEYRKKITKSEEEKDFLERKRINTLKEKLNVYIQRDLEKELSELQQQAAGEVKAAAAEEEAKATEEVAATEEVKVIEKAKADRQIEERVVKTEDRTQKIEEELKGQEKAAKLVFNPPVAVIIAKPRKGFSPLKVQFYGCKSWTLSGEIVSYYWDFGDGDTSVKKNPVNTYLSATYGVRPYIATLTVRDSKGNIGTKSIVIEVKTK